MLINFEERVSRLKFLPQLFIISFAIIQFFLQIWILTKGTRFIVSNLTIDDTLYYLQIAWNTWELGFATFDGLHPTNGVQFFWYFCLLGLAAIVPSKIILLYAAMSLTIFLNIMCYLIIWRIGNMLKRPWLGVWMSSLWMVVSLTTIYLQGMENSLHALVFWWLIYQVLAFLLSLEKNGSPPNMIPLTLALIVNVWVRMDSALFSVMLFMGCMVCLIFYSESFNQFWRTYSKRIFLVVILGILGLAIQLGAFWIMGDTLLPISAIIKMSGTHYPDQTANLGYFEALKMSLPLHFPHYLVEFIAVEAFKMSLPLHFPHYLVEFIAVIALAVSSLFRRQNCQQGRQAFLNMWWILFIAFITYHAVVVSKNMSYSSYSTWYRSPLYIFWVLTFGGVVMELLNNLERNRKTITLAGMIGISFIISSLAVSHFAITSKHLSGKSTYLSDIYEAAIWLSEKTPPQTILAGWNSGVLGYFSNRTTINLDGLENSHEYFTNVLSNPDLLTATQAYLIDKKVDYIIDFVEAKDVRALTDTLTHIRTFTPQNAAGWEGWKMWKVPSKFQPTSKSEFND